MELRRATWEAAIRLAWMVSALAVVATLGLEAVGDVSSPALLVTVAVCGFVASWIQTGRVARAERIVPGTIRSG